MTQSGEDEYESKFMSGDGQLLAREKLRFPWWMNALLVLPVTVAFTVLAATGQLDPVAATALAAPLFIIWGLLSVMRVAVSTTQMHIQYGIFGPKIAIDDIISAEASTYSVFRYGGYGIRKGIDGSTAYSVPGANGEGLLLRYRDKKGREKNVFISSKQSHVLLAAIEKARQGTLTTPFEETMGAVDAAKVTHGLLPVSDDQTTSAATADDDDREAAHAASTSTERSDKRQR